MPLITTEYDPKVCQCCGADATSDLQCVCVAYPDWHMNEHGDLACGYHKADLYMAKPRETVAVGIPNQETHDRWRNFRNTHE